MCGIAGILIAPATSNPQALTGAEKMAATMHHRGPDAGGLWLDREAGIALAHRRLAIVDLSAAGHQPMMSRSGRLVMTFNGEVYNFRAIRTDLESAGHCFRSGSDTEVMLTAIEQWGLEPALERFAGMFAFALWDRSSRRLHLARDRMGKKPLHLAMIGEALAFASEIRALRALRDFSPRLNQRALASVLAQGWVPDHECIYDGVFKLPPAGLLSIEGSQLRPGDNDLLRRRVRSYWSLAGVAQRGLIDPHRGSAEEVADMADGLLQQVVGERMVADVPLGAFLSGGIDSSTVVAIMQDRAAQPVRTFTIGFAEQGYDEAAHATAIARHLGTDHTEFRLTPDDARAVIPELPQVWDEPFADESQIPMLILSRLARKHVTVALSGDGGDECFAGYNRHIMAPRLSPWLAIPSPLRRPAAAFLRWSGPAVVGQLVKSLSGSSQTLQRLQSGHLQRLAETFDAVDEAALYRSLLGFGGRKPLLRDAGATRGIDTDFAVGPQTEPPLPDALARFIYRDMTGYLPGDILVKVDRATMAASLEARAPLLDHRLVEFAWRIPAAFKVRNGQGKWLLRRVLGRYLPERLFERPKQGFNVPVGEWLRGPLRPWAQDLLEPGRLRRQGLLDADGVARCWQEHMSGSWDRSRQLWAILMLEAWLETNPLEYRPVRNFVLEGVPA